MTKIKIKDLATELGVIYADLVTQVSSQLSLEIKGPLSLIDEEDANRIRDWMKAKGSQFSIEEKRVASRVIRRRKVNVPENATPEPETPAHAAEVEAAEPVEAVEPMAAKPASGNGASSTAKVEAEPVVEASVAPTAAAQQLTSDKNARGKNDYQALKVVEATPLKAPEVRDAPVFETPDRKPGDEAKSGEFGIAKPGVSRREIIEIRDFRPKQYGKKKAMPKKGTGKATEITTPKAIKRIIKISGSITIGELAKRMGIKVGEVIGKALGMGMMVTINQSVDPETAGILATEFSYEIENVAVDADETFLEQQPTTTGELKRRPPVVTVMGHVDHGKTSLLDYIRKTNVIKREFGGITQHIGAYDVQHTKGHIIFLDTPGHEAFAAMRARGAGVTDIVILVVAADDGVMPQTRESINHSKAAKVPIIVAINKIDKPEAQAERIKQALTEYSLVPEAWGGDTIFVEVSAKSGQGVNELLDMVLLQADVMDLKADPTRAAKGAIIESKLDRGRGAVATVLIQEGTLKIGDFVVCGPEFGKVRSLNNDRGERVKEAGPSIPVEVVGLSGIVQVGDVLHAVTDEKKARQVATARQERSRQKSMEGSSKLTLDQLYSQIEKGEVKELKVVVKGDVMGSVEAIGESLRKLSTDKVSINIIHSAVGGISESDVMLASASQALVIGFNVRPDGSVQQLAEKQGVELRLYTIIYDMVEEIKKAMAGLLAPKSVETVIGHVQIKEIFNIGKVGTIGGAVVTDGKITRSSRIRLLRDNVMVHEGQLASLKRFKDDAREVKNGLECGLSIQNFNDIKPGDIVEAFEVVSVQQEL